MDLVSCRLCGEPLRRTFVDLGSSPLANAYLAPEQLACMEPFYPLRVYLCESCLLVQLPVAERPEHIFSDYAYFSSYSGALVRQARAYAETMRERLALGPGSLVVEVASNDGYLLRGFREMGVPVLGIEPAENVARAAQNTGIETLVRFFGAAMARELRAECRSADLIAANNVLAHVPDLHDFVEGLSILLKPTGTLTIEVPHLVRLIEDCLFDTIYHEHFSYFTLLTLERALGAHGLMVVDVEEIPTHGGSLRIHARRAEAAGVRASERLEALRAREAAEGFGGLERYLGFERQVQRVKHHLLTFLLDARETGKRVAGYGAPAKATTLLNYCGIRTDLMEYTVDRSPHKQGRFLPGVRVPILDPEHLRRTRPDYVVILPWNLRDEIVAGAGFIREWGGRFVVPVPEVAVL